MYIICDYEQVSFLSRARHAINIHDDVMPQWFEWKRGLLFIFSKVGTILFRTQPAKTVLRYRLQTSPNTTTGNPLVFQSPFLTLNCSLWALNVTVNAVKWFTLARVTLTATWLLWKDNVCKYSQIYAESKMILFCFGYACIQSCSFLYMCYKTYTLQVLIRSMKKTKQIIKVTSLISSFFFIKNKIRPYHESLYFMMGSR